MQRLVSARTTKHKVAPSASCQVSVGIDFLQHSTHGTTVEQLCPLRQVHQVVRRGEGSKAIPSRPSIAQPRGVHGQHFFRQSLRTLTKSFDLGVGEGVQHSDKSKRSKYSCSLDMPLRTSRGGDDGQPFSNRCGGNVQRRCCAPRHFVKAVACPGRLWSQALTKVPAMALPAHHVCMHIRQPRLQCQCRLEMALGSVVPQLGHINEVSPVLAVLARLAQVPALDGRQNGIHGQVMSRSILAPSVAIRRKALCTAISCRPQAALEAPRAGPATVLADRRAARNGRTPWVRGHRRCHRPAADRCSHQPTSACVLRSAPSLLNSRHGGQRLGAMRRNSDGCTSDQKS
mmetsp:Transcript_75272/g.244771  ORF Transcript_75272/g.244771 Transcript_75272/m.244771 type:complete len:344 (+) Transcript_75272:876-1907(+)